MKGKFWLIWGLLLLGLLCTGCTPTPHTDYLAPLQGDFCADVAGEMNGVTFSALAEQKTAADGGRALTVTFYAPESLADTVIKRACDGEVSVSVGEVTVAGVPDGIKPLFDLFTPIGAVTDTEVTEQGHTKVTGEGFSVTLLPDGTPYLLENGSAKATVVNFRCDG